MTCSPTLSSRPATGRGVVAAIVFLGLCLAGFAFWFQWRQTRRCLDFFGADVARAVNHAERVELWRLREGGRPRRPIAVERIDVSRAPGMVHLRHALVEDASFVWPSGIPAAAAQPAPAWTTAIAFFSRAGASEPTAVLAFDHRFGMVTVVGRPGRVTLGRLGSGLDQWVRLVTGPKAPSGS